MKGDCLKEYTLFSQILAAEFPEALKIRLGQDNLNAHDISAFYENLPAANKKTKDLNLSCNKIAQLKD